MREKFIKNLIRLKSKKNLEHKIVEHTTRIAKGNKGDKGDDGKNYILTRKDKKEIASMIEVPIVEKIIERTEKEIIKEQPIITNLVDEDQIARKIEQDLPKLGEPIRDSLELLEKDDRLDKKAIKGLDDYDEIVKKSNIQGSDFGVITLEGLIYVNGSKTNVKQINIIAGTGITLAYNDVRGRGDITVSNSSVAGTVLTATGTINDSNLDFTFTSKPSIIIINGASYRETGGAITWSWATLTATLSSPVGVGGDIYGLK